MDEAIVISAQQYPAHHVASPAAAAHRMGELARQAGPVFEYFLSPRFGR
jgi:hypothetical protein